MEDPGAGRKAQRLRIQFARGPEASETGHLDLTRIWVDALTRAGVEVSYSQGRRPQPRLTMAAGLPMGVTSEGELFDVVTASVVVAGGLCDRLAGDMPDGLRALRCREVGLGLPSLPTVVRWADYDVDVTASRTEAETSVARFLAAESIPWEDTRGQKVRRYDLRPMAHDMAVGEPCGASTRITMRLRCGTEGVGRSDQVVKALGLPAPSRIHRTRLILADESRARTAWRRRGRYL